MQWPTEKVPFYSALVEIGKAYKTIWNKNSAQNKTTGISSSAFSPIHPTSVSSSSRSVMSQPSTTTAVCSRTRCTSSARKRERNAEIFQFSSVPPTSSCQTRLTDRLQPEGWHWCGEERFPCSAALGSACLKACTTDCMAACLIVDLSAWKLTVCAVCRLSHLHLYLLDFLPFISIKHQLMCSAFPGF